jgi:hypothetical protein
MWRLDFYFGSKRVPFLINRMGLYFYTLYTRYPWLDPSSIQAGATKKRKKRFWPENQKTEFASNLIKLNCDEDTKYEHVAVITSMTLKYLNALH